jgi:hypothetical protein
MQKSTSCTQQQYRQPLIPCVCVDSKMVRDHQCLFSYGSELGIWQLCRLLTIYKLQQQT